MNLEFLYSGLNILIGIECNQFDQRKLGTAIGMTLLGTIVFVIFGFAYQEEEYQGLLEVIKLKKELRKPYKINKILKRSIFMIQELKLFQNGHNNSKKNIIIILISKDLQLIKSQLKQKQLYILNISQLSIKIHFRNFLRRLLYFQIKNFIYVSQN